MCVKGIILLTTAVCTPHPVRVFSKCFSLLPHSRQITQKMLQLAHDTRWGLCNWTHPAPWKQVFRLCWAYSTVSLKRNSGGGEQENACTQITLTQPVV